jgi:hypothetical protein
LKTFALRVSKRNACEFFARATGASFSLAPSVCNLRKARKLRAVTTPLGFFSTKFSTQLLKSSNIHLHRPSDSCVLWHSDCFAARFDRFAAEC